MTEIVLSNEWRYDARRNRRIYCDWIWMVTSDKLTRNKHSLESRHVRVWPIHISKVVDFCFHFGNSFSVYFSICLRVSLMSCFLAWASYLSTTKLSIKSLWTEQHFPFIQIAVFFPCEWALILLVWGINWCNATAHINRSLGKLEWISIEHVDCY